ncbi:hypothetical protein [Saccharothrix variisporea]|uniref:Uncharacterized protein n=1 Tax=Saccharothrix variisporea TaxID=543527 RepID=A0A495X609_9PSEU|nr:hypothetical protein [Saccharothrix variisporea]RKT69500.1 hypothetical protein DFJ66_2730 [Saccharothrix variisporea]
MTSFLAESLVSVIVGLIISVVLAFLPVGSRKVGRRAGAAVAFLLAGEVIVLVSDSHDWLRGGLIVLEAAVLLLVELGGSGVLPGLLWIAVAGVGMWKWSELGPWVASTRPWVALGAVGAAAVCGFMAYERRRFRIDRRTMRGM